MANSRTEATVSASAALLSGRQRTARANRRAGPAGAAPEAVEGDLDDRFRPDRHRPGVPRPVSRAAPHWSY
ncbi:hypothetical protein, partial [Kitasatospora sp. NPDC056789]|uniref:hypothetical protein n=1 Tax=Kitasatospora sp. NPDC056789 TaxID=3345945 RepID=UPI003683B4DD